MAFIMDRSSSFCTGLVINIKNLYERLSKYKKLHHSNMTSCYLINSTEGNVEYLVNIERELFIKNNREIVHRVISFIILLSKQNIGFRGKQFEIAYNLKDLEKYHGDVLEKLLIFYQFMIE